MRRCSRSGSGSAEKSCRLDAHQGLPLPRRYPAWKAGQGYVAAPVFGRPEAAAAAKLFIVAAGADPMLVSCQPLFDALGQETFVISAKPSEANLVKLSGNFLIASMLESLREAFAQVRKAGIDPHRYLNILTNSLFSAPGLSNIRRHHRR
jgi:3-hydroxyisobutyrate dehydrogenase-like beta-hydroxyacid dehydrogenase